MTILIITCAICWNGGDGLKKLILSEAPKGWAEWEEANSHVEWLGTLRSEYQPESKRPRPDESIHVLINENMIIYDNNKNGNSNVTGFNNDYSFSLSKDSNNKQYTVRDFGSASGGEPARRKLFALRFAKQPYAIAGMPLAEMIRRKSFRILKVSEVARDGGICLRVDFEFKPDKQDETAIRGGWILLSPSDHWAHTESAITTPWGELIGKIVLDRKLGEFPAIRSSDITLKGKKKKLDMKFNFEKYQYKNIDESNFTLSSFGLPELHNVTGQVQRNSSPYWLFGIGASAAAVAIWLKLPKRGRSTALIPTDHRPDEE